MVKIIELDSYDELPYGLKEMFDNEDDVKNIWGDKIAYHIKGIPLYFVEFADEKRKDKENRDV